MVRQRLTEKHMNDRRFRKTEEAIFYAYFGGDIYISTGEMAKRAGISRSTFYRHHSTVGAIMADYERYAITKFSRAIRRMTRKDIRLKNIFMKTLYFLLMNKPLFEMLIKSGNKKVITGMVNSLRPYIEKSARLTGDNRMIFRVYAGEITEVIVDWIERGFKEDAIEVVVDDLMYLTKTARNRLKPLGSSI